MTEFIHTLDTKLRFGKYKGNSLREIIDIDPSYLVWCHNTISWFKMEKADFDYAVDKSTEYRFQRTIRRYMMSDPSDSPYWFEDDNGSWLS